MRDTIWLMRCLRSKVRTTFCLIVRRVEALGKFLDTEDGKNLFAGYKRAANIIRIEEKKDGRGYTGAPEPGLYKQDEEKALAQAITEAKAEAERCRGGRRFRSRHARHGEAAARTSTPSSTR